MKKWGRSSGNEYFSAGEGQEDVARIVSVKTTLVRLRGRRTEYTVKTTCKSDINKWRRNPSSTDTVILNGHYQLHQDTNNWRRNH